MPGRFTWAVVSVLLFLATAACGPTTPAAPVATVRAVPTAASAPAANPSRQPLRITLNQEPDTLNPFSSGLRATFTVTQAIFNGLVVVNEQGEYEGDLAAEVPTVQNGGVSPDGLTITYKLRQGVKWADGEPFTADDVKFTYDAIMNPANTICGKSVYGKIDSLAVQDPNTVQLKMKEPYAAYAGLFSYPIGILPKHALDSLSDLNKADFNRKPFGTGPYRVTDWQAASSIQLEATPYYYKGVPNIGQVVFRIVPRQEHPTRPGTGERDRRRGGPDRGRRGPGRPDPRLDVLRDRRPDVRSAVSEPGDAEGLRPHPILGDARVRQALQLGINKQQLVDKVLSGKTRVASSDYPIGWAAPSIEPTRFDADAARQLLDDAGWRVDADGIREKNGQKLHLTIATTSANTLRENVEQLIQAGWKSIGVDLEIKNAAAAVLVGEWADNGLVQRGNFDIAYYGFMPGIDPSGTLSPAFHSSQIPYEGNAGEGDNASRYRNPQADQWLDDADRTLDQSQRKALYGNVMHQVAQDLPVIYLYNRANVEAFMLCIPRLLVLLLAGGFFGTSLGLIVVLIGLTAWMHVARLVRASFLSLREREFVEAARALGAGHQLRGRRPARHTGSHHPRSPRLTRRRYHRGQSHENHSGSGIVVRRRLAAMDLRQSRDRRRPRRLGRVQRQPQPPRRRRLGA
jgi:peptide/nickel transport system substrate-binding protein